VSSYEEHLWKILLQTKKAREKLSRWRLCTSIHTWRTRLNDAYMRQSAPKVLSCYNF